jgi:hypothetical protein
MSAELKDEDIEAAIAWAKERYGKQFTAAGNYCEFHVVEAREEQLIFFILDNEWLECYVFLPEGQQNSPYRISDPPQKTFEELLRFRHDAAWIADFQKRYYYPGFKRAYEDFTRRLLGGGRRTAESTLTSIIANDARLLDLTRDLD